MRYGYPTRHDSDIAKDDVQLFRCERCFVLPLVKHNGRLPRLERPVHWEKKRLIEQSVVLDELQIQSSNWPFTSYTLEKKTVDRADCGNGIADSI